MRIIVMGSGGTGGYFGAKLARAGEDVTFVARGEHLRAIQAGGLSVTSATEGSWTVKAPAVEHLDGLPAADLVLLRKRFCPSSARTPASSPSRMASTTRRSSNGSWARGTCSGVWPWSLPPSRGPEPFSIFFWARS